MSANTRGRTKKKCNWWHIVYKRLVLYIKQTVPGKYSIERTIWITVHLVAFATLSFMIYDTTIAYRNTPTATHMETDAYPINKLNFPAVVICNINLISKRRAEQYVDELLQKKSIESMNLTKARILELFKYVGHLYTFSFDEEQEEDIKLLHKILQRASGQETPYNVETLTRKVGVLCDSYVVRCQWEGVVRTCADILDARYTSDGKCCTFNYARWKDHFTRAAGSTFAAPIQKSEIAGSEFGLWLLLDVNEDDYFYQLLPFVGFKVLIYGSTDYPDVPSGGTREILVAKGTETFLNIGASVFDSTEDVRQVPSDRRHCLFESDKPDQLAGEYSFSDCVMICRVKDINDTCNCTPYFYPRPSGFENVRQCHFDDLKCLNYHQNRWWGIEPLFEPHDAPYPPGAFSERPEGHMNCQCYPSCTNTDYTVSKVSGNLRDDVIVWETDKNVVNRTDDHTVLNVYFGRSPVMKLRHDVQYYWYELMSNYGGVCSIFLGLSIMSGIEVIYKFCQSLFGKRKQIKKALTRVAPMRKTITFTEEDIMEEDPQINWQEINAGNLFAHLEHNLDNVDE